MPDVIGVENIDPYPEHTKLNAIVEQSQAIGEFLDLGPYTLCEWKEAPDVPRWIDERTGTDKDPRGHRVHAMNTHTRENLAWYPAGYYPVTTPIQKLLAEYFGIDLDKIEEEKRAMLDDLRKVNHVLRRSRDQRGANAEHE